MKAPLLIATILSSAALSTASASDFLDQTYVKVGAGPAFVQDMPIQFVSPFYPAQRGKVEFDPGVRADLTFGYNVNDNWAAEFNAGYIRNSEGFSDWDFEQIPFMMDVVYRIPLKGSFKPYVGAGMGGVQSSLDTVAVSPFVSSLRRVSATDINFGYQATAGILYSITERATVDLGYKFLGVERNPLLVRASDGSPSMINTGNAYTHALLVSFTWRF